MLWGEGLGRRGYLELWGEGRDVPESNDFCLSSLLAPDSSNKRGMSLLRLCQAEKFDKLVSIILVVYSNSSLTILHPPVSGFSSRLSRASTTFLRYPQPWKFRLSRPSILATRPSSFCQKARAVEAGRRRED